MTWAAAVAAFASSVLTVVALERFASRLRLIDRPNERSSHVMPKPRGGGLGVIVGTLVGLLVVWLAGTTIDGRLGFVLGATLFVALVGLADDLRSLSPWLRLIAQCGAASVVVWACGGLERLPLPQPLDYPLGPLGAVLSVVWIVGVTNFFNFMDGADGLAAGQAAITFAAVALVLLPMGAGVLAVVSLGAVLGFFLRNWAPARIFLGDVGSGWLGFLLASLPFTSGTTEAAVLLVATSLALFLIDPAVTLLLRWRRGASLTTSHREHLYQRLVVPGRSHAGPVAALLALAAAISLCAVYGYLHSWASWWAVAAALVAYVIEHWLVSAATSRSQ